MEATGDLWQVAATRHADKLSDCVLQQFMRIFFYLICTSINSIFDLLLIKTSYLKKDNIYIMQVRVFIST